VHQNEKVKLRNILNKIDVKIEVEVECLGAIANSSAWNFTFTCFTKWRFTNKFTLL